MESSNENRLNFSSYLGNMISSFFEERRKLGYIYHTEEQLLRRFDKYCVEKHLETSVITKDFLQDWMLQTESEGPRQYAKRMSATAQFLLYLSVFEENTYIPSGYCHYKRRLPHIFSSDELKAIFKEIDSYVPSKKKANWIRLSNEYKVLFRLIYTCGLRNSEACHLVTANINFDQFSFKVIDSKGKDRIVYLANDMRDLCREYYEYITVTLGAIPKWFFPSLLPDRPLRNTSIDRRFLQAWENTEFSKNCNDKPVVHDFRYTFVVNRINRWVEQGDDLEKKMPYLIKYLGHKSFAETHYYYHLSQEALRIIRSKDKTGDSCIPEVRLNG